MNVDEAECEWLGRLPVDRVTVLEPPTVPTSPEVATPRINFPRKSGVPEEPSQMAKPWGMFVADPCQATTIPL